MCNFKICPGVIPPGLPLKVEGERDRKGGMMGRRVGQRAAGNRDGEEGAGKGE